MATDSSEIGRDAGLGETAVFGIGGVNKAPSIQDLQKQIQDMQRRADEQATRYQSRIDRQKEIIDQQKEKILRLEAAADKCERWHD